MGALKSLTFTALPKIGANPILDRRTNMIARLEEQKCLLNDPNYVRTVRTWVKRNGQLTPVGIDANGKVARLPRAGGSGFTRSKLRF
jgi:hypothetical protein